MDALSPKADDRKAAKPTNGGQSQQQFPLTLEDPQPPSIMPRALRSAAQAATVGIFIILFFVALSLAKPIAASALGKAVADLLAAPDLAGTGS